jgi:hypothetical protein
MQAQLTLNTPQTPKHEAPGPRAEFVDASAAAPFLVGGDAVVTFESRKTGVRFTYQIRLAEPRQGDDREPPHFVSVLTGPNNSADYVYLGCIFSKKVYSHGKNSKIDRSAPSAVAFAWAWRHLSAGKMPEGLAVWHEGRCARCGRRLSTPRSIATGFGPVCEGKARL